VRATALRPACLVLLRRAPTRAQPLFRIVRCPDDALDFQTKVCPDSLNRAVEYSLLFLVRVVCPHFPLLKREQVCCVRVKIKFRQQDF
jgi:hypothetical protein